VIFRNEMDRFRQATPLPQHVVYPSGVRPGARVLHQVDFVQFVYADDRGLIDGPWNICEEMDGSPIACRIRH
jgi:hypothetical protein